MTQGKQLPWELSSLEGQFYFSNQAGAGRDLAAESKRLDDERQKIAQEREFLEKQSALEEERGRLEALKSKQAKPSRPAVSEAKEPAMGPRPSASTANEMKIDGRFIAYDNGTVLDARTNLIWAAKDNGTDINWNNAKSYCDNYRGGGYTDWRMPTQDELAGLYDTAQTYQPECRGFFGSRWDLHLTELIRLTCIAPWASETRGSEAAGFRFDGGVRYWGLQSGGENLRALPVRSAK
jgi:hypothetical protein